MKISILIFLLLASSFSHTAMGQSTQEKAELKALFTTGAKPTEEDFGTLIEHTYNKASDTTLVVEVQGGGMRISDQVMTVLNSRGDTLFQFIRLQRTKNKQFTDHIDQLYITVDTLTDNNYTDAAKAKLGNVESNANNYQLPLANFDRIGGIKLGPDFITFNQKLYTTLDSRNIQRQYAADTTAAASWTEEMKDGDRWTRLRMKFEELQADGSKKSIYGEWNEPYKFNYQQLEDELTNYLGLAQENMIIGTHRTNSDDKHGIHNTMLGNRAGYSASSLADSANVYAGQAAGEQHRGAQNVLIGAQAGQYLSGDGNVVIGAQAAAQKNATNTVLIGAEAGYASESDQSIFIGQKAGRVNNGLRNLAVGHASATLGTQGQSQDNIVLGHNSLTKATASHNNIILGHQSGQNQDLRQGNILIGHGLTASADQVILGHKGARVLEATMGQNRNIKLLENTTVAGSLKAKEFRGPGTIPIGGIIMWSGNTNNIPNGWALCNGRKGTPDLKDRFVVGAGETYSAHQRGGRSQYQFTISRYNLPPHTHHAGTLKAASKFITHNHGMSQFRRGIARQDSPHWTDGGGPRRGVHGNRDPTAGRTDNASTSHGHDITGYTDSGNFANHPISVPTVPPYYALAYIMRIK